MLMFHCRVVRVEMEAEESGSGYVITAERRQPAERAGEADAQQATAMVPAEPATGEEMSDPAHLQATTEVEIRTATKPVLATGFHSGVGKLVNHLFEWTEESACGTGEAQGGIMKGDPKLSKCDESTLCSGLFLVGPQVVQEDQIVRIAH